jgi:pimeloyl-ACP methyl ester carboxylesterase
VLTTAARDSRIAAIVAQCPMMDGRASVLQIWRYAGLRQLLRPTAHGTLDLLMAPFGFTHYINAAGPRGSLAVITSNGAAEGFRAIAPKDFRWKIAARIGVFAGFYRPVRRAQQLRCPALIQICEKDSVMPPEAAEAVARIMGDRAEVCRYPLEHFDPYLGENFERSVTDEGRFPVPPPRKAEPCKLRSR